MKRKTICIGIISILLLAGISMAATAVETNIKKNVTEQQLLKNNEKTGYIEGYVRDEFYNPINAAEIEAWSMLYVVSKGKLGAPILGETNDLGYYKIEVPANSNYFMFSTHPSYLPTGIGLTYVREGESSQVDMTLFTMFEQEDIGWIEGHVKNFRGDAIVNAALTASSLWPPIGAQGKSDSNGHYNFTLIGDLGYQVTATAKVFEIGVKEYYMMTGNIIHVYKGKTSQCDLNLPQINAETAIGSINDDYTVKTLNINFDCAKKDATYNYQIDFDGDEIFDYEKLNTKDNSISVKHDYEKEGYYKTLVQITEGDINSGEYNVGLAIITVHVKEGRNLIRFSHPLIEFLSHVFPFFKF